MGATGFDPGVQLGPRLRRVRQQRGLSVRELARRISCSPSLISQIERGLSAPSVGVLYALASELQTSLDFLFGVAGPADVMTATAHGGGQLRPARPSPAGPAVIQRAGHRQVIDLASGVRWERLTPGPDDRVDFLEVIYEPSGTLMASVGFDTFELGPGDSIAFDSAIPHQYWNATGADVHVISVVVHAQPGRA